MGLRITVTRAELHFLARHQTMSSYDISTASTVMAGLVPATHAVVAGADAGRLGHHHDQPLERRSLHRRNL